MEYQNIEQLNSDFINGKIVVLPQIINMAGLEYKLLKGSENNFEEMIIKHLKAVIIYSLVKSETNIENFKKVHHHTEDSIVQDNIAFFWGFKNLYLIPMAAKFIYSGRSTSVVNSGIVKEANIENDRIIQHNISIILSGFNDNQQMPAKVDTGAQICSLHAENIKYNPNQNMVTFTFGEKRYTMPTLELQAVKTADNGVENRPVVTFDISVLNSSVDIKNKIVKRVKFNLNDRSSMPDKILLGQNFITAGNFVVVSDNENTIHENLTDDITLPINILLENKSNLDIALLLEIADNISSEGFVNILKLHLPESERNKLQINKKYKFKVRNNILVIMDGAEEIINLSLKSDKLSRDYAWQSSKKDINPFIWR